MTNTVTTTTLVRNPNRVVLYVTVLSDGSEETDLVVYDSSAQSALIKTQSGLANVDPLDCKIRALKYSSNSVAGIFTLKFVASTPVLAWPLGVGMSDSLDFSSSGGLLNYAGTGKNGDITLTTTGLANGDSLAFLIDVVPF